MTSNPAMRSFFGVSPGEEVIRTMQTLKTQQMVA
jgi:hypothetical protein